MSIPENFVFMKNPPTRKRDTKSKYNPIADACRRHPNMWTIFNNDVTCGMIGTLKKQFPDFEFTSRANPPDGNRATVTVYGRFVGKKTVCPEECANEQHWHTISPEGDVLMPSHSFGNR